MATFVHKLSLIEKAWAKSTYIVGTQGTRSDLAQRVAAFWKHYSSKEN